MKVILDMGRMRRVTAASSATRQQKPPAKQSKQAKKIVQSDLGASKRVSTCSPGGEKPRDLEFENSQFFECARSKLSFVDERCRKARVQVCLKIESYICFVENMKIKNRVLFPTLSGW